MPEPQSPKFGPAERGRSDRETRVRLKGLFLLKIMVQISSKSDDRFCHSGFPNMAVSAFFARLGDERVRLNSKYFFFSHQGRSLPSCSPLFFRKYSEKSSRHKPSNSRPNSIRLRDVTQRNANSSESKFCVLQMCRISFEYIQWFSNSGL